MVDQLTGKFKTTYLNKQETVIHIVALIFGILSPRDSIKKTNNFLMRSPARNVETQQHAPLWFTHMPKVVKIGDFHAYKISRFPSKQKFSIKLVLKLPNLGIGWNVVYFVLTYRIIKGV